MRKETVREIIRANLGRSPRQGADSGFMKWMLDREHYAEKEDALKELWDEPDSTPVRHLMENPHDLIAEAERTCTRKPSYRRLMPWAASTAAACLILFGIFLGTGMFTRDMYLASGEYSKGYFVLPDSSQVWLNKDSRLYIAKGMGGRTRKVRLEGEGYFEVTKDTRRPFIVQTDEFDVTVLGTKFTVTAYEDQPAAAYLSEGSVKVSGTDAPETVLKPNQMFSRDVMSGEWKVTDESAANHTAWIGESLVFDEAPISDIIECMEHWYNVRITLADDRELRGLNLSMTVRSEPLEEILAAMERLAGVRHRFLTDSHVFLTME